MGQRRWLPVGLQTRRRAGSIPAWPATRGTSRSRMGRQIPYGASNHREYRAPSPRGKACGCKPHNAGSTPAGASTSSSATRRQPGPLPRASGVQLLGRARYVPASGSRREFPKLAEGIQFPPGTPCPRPGGSGTRSPKPVTGVQLSPRAPSPPSEMDITLVYGTRVAGSTPAEEARPTWRNWSTRET